MKQQPAWGPSREFEITTRSVGRTSITQTTTGDLEEEEGDDDDELVHGQRKRKVAFMPSVGEYFDYQVVQYELFLHVCYEGTTHTIYYRGHWLRVR